jgi:hydrogenase maturation protease
MIMRTLVIGWGNPLRGDDGLGWKAAGEIAEAIPEAEVRVSHQLMPEFAEDISRSDLVIFIDAACDNSWGELRTEAIQPRCCPSAAFSHELDPAGLLGLAERLYGRCPEAILCSVGGRWFGYGEKLSREVQSALPLLLEKIRQVTSS